MSIKAQIRDSLTKQTATVNSKGALLVAADVPDIQPAGTANRRRFFSQRVGSTGAGAGTTNMNVNGAVTPQTFYVGSSSDYDIYIMGAIITIADAAVVHSAFGNVAALAVGWDLVANESGFDTYLIQKAQTGGQVIAQSGYFNGFGDAATSFELTNWAGGSDATLAYLPIGEWIPGGIRIGRASTDRIKSVVNDDLTGLTEFYVRLVGYRLYP